MVLIFGYTVAVAIQRCSKTIVVKERARKKFLAVRNLWPRHAELQAPPFVGLEWDGQPEVILYNRGFADQVSHELRPDGYYYVHENVYEEMDSYTASLECSDEDGDGDGDCNFLLQYFELGCPLNHYLTLSLEFPVIQHSHIPTCGPLSWAITMGNGEKS